MTAVHQSVQIPARAVSLEADVAVPPSPIGTVVFAHGSGSGRHSPRNRYVAEHLQQAGLASVLADLLTLDEERDDAHTGAFRFDIVLLTGRLLALTDWVVENEATAGLPVGIFGASTGAAAALVTAAARPSIVSAVVSRGGRPDLAAEHLPSVRQPTLLIVGGRDPVVLELNRRALAELGGEARLEIIPGATHLFEEPGALDAVARLARDWFARHLPGSAVTDG